jgi:signal transduction histidine kinase
MERGGAVNKKGSTYRLLPGFASFILDHLREEFLQYSREKLFEHNVPVLREMARDEAEALADKSNLELLDALAEGNPALHIQKAIDRWRKEQFPRVQRNHNVVEDVTKIAHVRKLSFVHFVSRYAKDELQTIELIKEVEEYLLEYTATTLHDFVEIIDSRLMTQLHRLEESENLYKSAERIAKIGNWRWEVAANKVHWTDGLFRIYDMEPGSIDVTFEVFLAYVHEDDRGMITETISNSLRTLQPFELFHRIVTDKGKVRALHSRGEVLTNDKGKVHEMIGSAQDVTDLKEAEGQLREQQEILERKTRELQESNANLEEFAFVASHDLKEPLRKISVLLSALQESVVLQTDKERLLHDRIIAAAARMRNLIDDLLSLSLLSANTNKSPHSLQDVVDKALSVFENEIAAQGVVVTCQPLPVVPMIRSQLDQLFQNLISNALKFMRPGVTPQITITNQVLTPSTSAELYNLGREPHLEIVVADNGIGFSNVYGEKIFAVFQRLHNKDEFEGTGIGLAICRKVVKNHQGIILANATLGVGAEFRVIIPLNQLA